MTTRYRLPPLNSLRAFEAAARHLSFTRAAAELSVSQGAISRHIGILEGHLGAKLFSRLHREVQLTDAGFRFLHAIQDGFDVIDAGTRQVSPRNEDLTLRLKIPPTLAIRWLIPRLGRFNARHPQIAVHMNTSHKLANFSRGDLDGSIENGVGEWKDLIFEELFPVALVTICSPRLADGSPPPKRPEDLSHYHLLHSMQRPGLWRQWLQAAGVSGIPTDQGSRFQNSGLVYQAALDGVGIGITEAAYLRDDLERGRLVAPFGLTAIQPDGYYLVFPPGKARLRPFAVFRQWILDEAKATRRELQIADRVPRARPLRNKRPKPDPR